MVIIEDEVIMKELEPICEGMTFDKIMQLSLEISEYINDKESELRSKLGIRHKDVQVETMIVTEFYSVLKLIETFKHVVEKDLESDEFSVSALRTTQYLTSIDAELSMASKVKSNCDSVCPRCKEQNAFANSVQTRAADEAATIIILCLSCKMKWRGC